MTVDRENPATGGPATLIEHYEAVACASHRMLEAAYLGDWDRVEALEARCSVLIEALKREALFRDDLSEEEQERRLALLRAILSDDAQIRACAEPWLRDLDEYLA